MAHGTNHCHECGCLFTPAPHNVKHQIYCTRPSCVARRRRKRQNPWYRQRYAANEAFRADAKKRVHRSRSSAFVASPTPALEPLSPSNTTGTIERINLMILGLAAQMSRETDPAQVHALCVTWLDLGRRLSPVATAKVEHILEFQ